MAYMSFSLNGAWEMAYSSDVYTLNTPPVFPGFRLMPLFPATGKT